MSFLTNRPRWDATGVKPPEEKLVQGWLPGERPPAAWHNWILNRLSGAVLELEQRILDHESSSYGVHGLKEDEQVESTKGAQEKADLARNLAKEYADSIVAEHANQTGGVHGVPEGHEIEWKASAQEKADAAKAAAIQHAERYTDDHSMLTSGVHGIPQGHTIATVEILEEKISTAFENVLASAKNYTDLHELETSGVHGVPLGETIETVRGAQEKADEALELAKLYTQEYVNEALNEALEDIDFEFPDIKHDDTDPEGYDPADDSDETKNKHISNADAFLWNYHVSAHAPHPGHVPTSRSIIAGQGLSGGGDLTKDVYIWVEDNSIDDLMIGEREIDDSESPTNNSGSLTQLFGWLANRIKAILGQGNWNSSPPITLKATKDHVDSTGGVHGVPQGQKVEWQAGAQAKADAALNAAKSYADSILNSAKSYADTVGTNTLNSAKSYTDTATSNTLNSAKRYTDQVASGKANISHKHSWSDLEGDPSTLRVTGTLRIPVS